MVKQYTRAEQARELAIMRQEEREYERAAELSKMRTERSRAWAERTGAAAEKIKGKAWLLSSRVEAVRTGMSLANWVVPALIGALILIFIIGPGALGIFAIAQGLPWWGWILAIFIAVYFMRDR